MSPLQVTTLAIILFFGTVIHHIIVEYLDEPLHNADPYSLDVFCIATITTTLVELGVICGAFWLIEHVRII